MPLPLWHERIPFPKLHQPRKEKCRTLRMTNTFCPLKTQNIKPRNIWKKINLDQLVSSRELEIRLYPHYLRWYEAEHEENVCRCWIISYPQYELEVIKITANKTRRKIYKNIKTLCFPKKLVKERERYLL